MASNAEASESNRSTETKPCDTADLIRSLIKSGPYIMTPSMIEQLPSGGAAIRPCRVTPLMRAGEIFFFLVGPSIAFGMAHMVSMHRSASGAAILHGSIAAVGILIVCFAILLVSQRAYRRLTHNAADYLRISNRPGSPRRIESPAFDSRIEDCARLVVFEGRTVSDGSSTHMRYRVYAAFSSTTEGQLSPMFAWEQTKNFDKTLQNFCRSAGIDLALLPFPPEILIGSHEFYSYMSRSIRKAALGRADRF